METTGRYLSFERQELAEKPLLSQTLTHLIISQLASAGALPDRDQLQNCCSSSGGGLGIASNSPL
jgi:hypothetical protein